VFTDLQGFTTLTEVLRGKSVNILSRYMETMVPIIRKHNGYVNKFLGDGIMFFFGAPEANPDHAADAVAAILEMQQAMVPFNAALEADGLPTLYMRAGISTGPMVVGDAGPSFAADYTVLGDRVNLAARLESANKATGTANLATDRTVELAGDKFLFRPVATLQVVGKKESIITYEALARKDEADDRQRRLAQLTGVVVRAFVAKDFDGCCEAIDELEEEFGPSKLTKLYHSQCEECMTKPPDEEEWVGSISLREK
jgi:adenylate cyclase